VQSRYGTNRVFVVRNGQLAGREVVLGDRLGDRVEVAQGLEAGTEIVAGDVEQLADGMRVAAGAGAKGAKGANGAKGAGANGANGAGADGANGANGANGAGANGANGAGA
jgi:hypothetical protein